jgi:hypothetical protein
LISIFIIIATIFYSPDPDHSSDSQISTKISKKLIFSDTPTDQLEENSVSDENHNNNLGGESHQTAASNRSEHSKVNFRIDNILFYKKIGLSPVSGAQPEINRSHKRLIYTVQVATFDSARIAKNTAKKLKKLGLETFLAKTQGARQYSLHHGVYRSKRKASDKALSILREFKQEAKPILLNN